MMRSITIKFLAIVLGCFMMGQMSAQIVPTHNTTQTFAPANGEMFYDPSDGVQGGVGGDCSQTSGGHVGDYAQDGLTVTTLTGTDISVSFEQFKVFAPFDYLRIYDGTTTGGTLLLDGQADNVTDLTDMEDHNLQNPGTTNFKGNSDALTFEFFATEAINSCGYAARVALASALVCTLTCPDDITVDVDLTTCTGIVNLTAPVPSADCVSMVVLDPDDEDYDTEWTPTIDGVAQTVGTCDADLFSIDCTMGYPAINGSGGPNPSFDDVQMVVDDDADAAFVGVACFTSNALDLSGGGINLSFDWENEALGGAGHPLADVFTGCEWVNVWEGTATNGFGSESISLAAYNNGNFQVRLCYDDDGGWNWGAAYDNISVAANPSAGAPVALNDLTCTADLINEEFEVGVHTVTWSTTDMSGNIITCSTDITVLDAGPQVICPSDVNVTLSSGECCTFQNYNLDFLSCNPAPPPTPAPADIVALAANPFGSANNGFAGVAFDVSNTAGEDLLITSFDADIDPGTHPVHLYYSVGSTYFGIQNAGTLGASDANWIFVGEVMVTGSGTAATNVPLSFLLPAGECKGVMLSTTDGSMGYVNINGTNNVFSDGSLSMFAGSGHGGPFLNNFGPPNGGGNCSASTAGRALVGGVNYALASSLPTPVVQIAGLASGECFPIGTTTNSFTYTDAAGLSDTCSFDVNILEYPFPTTELACNDEVNISFDGDCCVTILADMILEGNNHRCYDEYIITITDANGNAVPNPVCGDYAGQQLSVTITDTATGASCWGFANMEDKSIPDLLCTSLVVGCDIASVLPGEVNDNVPVFLTASLDTSTIQFGQAVACPGGMYSYLRVIDLSAAGIFTELEIDRFRMGVETATGPVDGILKFYTFNDPNAYTAGQMAFNYSDMTQAGATNISTIPALNLAHWEMPVSGVTIPSGTRWLVWDLEVPGGNSVNFVMGSNTAGETTPTYLASTFCGAPNPQTLSSVGPFNGNWVSMIFGTHSQVIPFPVPDTAIVTPSSGTGPFVVTDFDACGPIDLTFIDEEIDIDCTNGSGFTAMILRHWTATDGSGNSSNCTDTIRLRAATLETVSLPVDRDGVDAPVLECHGTWDYGRDGRPDTGDEGEGDGIPQPYEIGDDVVGACDLWVSYDDDIHLICGYSGKIFRTWHIVDNCTGLFMDHIQLIIIKDADGPTVDCQDYTIGSDPYTCSRTWEIPAPIAYDDCSEVTGWTVTSNAGTIIEFNGIYTITGLPVGVSQLTYSVYDGCGNTTECVSNVTVVDDIAPVPICDVNTQVSLGADGRARIYASTFDDGSYDNCGVAVIEVRRSLPSTCYDPTISATFYRPYVEFCCDDVVLDLDGNIVPVIVEMRVTDYAGNSNICWVNVRVEDKLPPVIVCPPDIFVSCDFKFDLNDLGTTFGRVVLPQEDEVREGIYIDDINFQEDCLLQTYAGPVHVGYDGYATDNCGLTVSEIANANLTCGQGVITRIFTATDGNGRTASCIQRITVVDCDPFTITDTDNRCREKNGVYLPPNHPDADDVEWPCDVLLDGCSGADVTPAGIQARFGRDGYPIYEDDKCSLVADTFEDLVFTIVADACFKILRTWKISDWCQRDANGLPLIWEFTQVIKVLDEEGPVVNAPDPGCDESATECAGYTDLYPDVTDCTPDNQLVYWWRIDAYNDGQGPIPGGFDFEGSTDLGNPDPSGVYPYGTHRILWVIEDMCGNKSTTEYEYDVDDCKRPSPVCINGLSSVVMPSSGQITVWAVDFDASSFDNCDTDLDFRIWYPYMDSTSYPAPHPDPTKEWIRPSAGTTGDMVLDYLPSGAVFYCEAMGNGQSETFIVEIYVIDDYGNWDFCTTNITIDDNDDVCLDGMSVLIAGTYMTEAGEAVDQVAVSVTGSNNTLREANNEADGSFRFLVEADAPGFDWEVIGEKSDNYLNGVTAQDLSLIQRHIAGIEYLNSNYKKVAADANADQCLDIRDVLDLRKLLLGIYDELPSNNSWRSIDADYTFPGATTDCLPEDVYSHEMMPFFSLLTDEMETDFIASKIGDVDGDATPNSLLAGDERDTRTLNFEAKDATFAPGDVVNVEFTAENFNEVTAYQFTLGFDQSVLEYVESSSSALNVAEGNFGTQLADRGIVTTVWYNANAETVGGAEVLFTMTFVAREAGTLSSVVNVGSTITEAIAFSNETGKSGVELRFSTENGQIVDNAFALFQNTPNPFKDVTTIGYVLPEASEVTLTVYDMNGRVLMTTVEAGTKGINHFELNHSALGATGVLHYQVKTDDFSATKKMVVVD